MGSPLQEWSTRLQRALRASGSTGRVVVLAETGSTQDAARRMAAAPGDVVVALRQRAGRGRHGRGWADTVDDGLAVTLVVEPDEPARLAPAGAVAVAEAIESVAGRPIGLKWPNDLIVDDRKLGGILIEQDGWSAAIGIGINVAQESWPDDLDGRAVSLRQLGVETDRLAVAEAIVTAVPLALARDEADLAAAFSARDVLRGRPAVILSGTRRVVGRVVEIDPARWLVVEVDGRRERIPAATASIESWG